MTWSHMEWYPKQFGPGDLDGVGARRLLGTPNISSAEILVRETGQNSWDARGNADHITFTINLRTLDADALTFLRNHVFTGPATGTGLASRLESDHLFALEISDHGTVGLDGPVRNDRAVPADQSTNFIDLILNIGAPRDVHLGGGTYGFGKTIAYSVSSVGAVLFWSRCRVSEGRQDRLIGSAIGDGFEDNGLRYTGRHWWGRVTEGRIEPLLGRSAKSVAERVFHSRYLGPATGTSALILDPQLGTSDPEQMLQRLREAIVWHLWPKLLPPEGRPRMQIRLQRDGSDVEVPPLATHPVLSGHAMALAAVRRAQAGEAVEPDSFPLPVRVREIRSLRPDKLLGHLALVRYPVPARAGRPPLEGDLDPPVDGPSHHVALMRHDAELVVRYLPGRRLDVDGFQWAGVFKPVAATDDSFAAAEPPAHDDWQPAAVPSARARRDVNVALKRIKEAVEEFLGPLEPVRPDAAPKVSAAAVGDMLAGLIGGIDGSAPTRNGDGPGPTGQRRRMARARVRDIEHMESPEPGWTRVAVGVGLENSGSSGAEVRLVLRVGVEGGSEESNEHIRAIGWQDSDDATSSTSPDVLFFAPDEQHRFVFEARPDVAVDVRAVVVREND